MPIRQLAPDVAAKIAAGEVVERPASVVKELIENSIDAGATQIRVDLMHGGLQLIRVSDNGSGISPDELPLALARHATSKVTQIDDLEHIRSLGFRGEALASIAAVADVTLLSRQRGGEHGAEISASNGQLSGVTAAASSDGTTLTVRNLFSAVPARFKFLKSRNTEVGHCHHLLEQYALAYPEIRFTVSSEGRQIFATPGDGQLFHVLVEVYGLQIAEQMVAVAGEQREDAEYPVVTGYVSRPACYKSSRQHISFFVNRRWVLSRMLTAAVEGAYHSLLLPGRHPVAVINIQVDPTVLDVNVHPAKTEIRFLKERRVFAAILRATRQALLEEPEMAQWSPRAASADTAFPEAEDNQSSDSDDDAIPQDNPWITVNEEETGSKPPLLSRLWQSHIHNSDTTQQAPSRRAEAANADPLASITFEAEPTELSQLPGNTPGDANDNDLFRIPPLPPTPSRRDDPPPLPTEATKPPESMPQVVHPQQAHHLPQLRVIGQLAQSYIVTEGKDGMFLVDQHAAHERILLERMIAALKAQAPFSQLLLTPLPIELAPLELEAIEEHIQQLEHIGFALKIVDGKTLEVQAVPNILVKRMNNTSIHELLIELTAAENLGHTETWEERALANVACKAAIKQNYFLTVGEMREMLEQLEQTQAPYSCCHGRPTMVHFSLSSLEHEFGRR
jgi:DNA mismatch repair protein MutL